MVRYIMVNHHYTVAQLSPNDKLDRYGLLGKIGFEPKGIAFIQDQYCQLGQMAPHLPHGPNFISDGTITLYLFSKMIGIG